MSKLAVDASNISSGGGLRHLQSLLAAAAPARHGIKSVTLWANSRVLDGVAAQPWLIKRRARLLEGPLPARLLWQQALLPRILASESFDLLFSPGGTIPFISPIPVVTMSQNLLPFSPGELARLPVFDGLRLKMNLLRPVQAASFSRAQAVIFLSRFAEKTVREAVRIAGVVEIIPHGPEEELFSLTRSAMEPTGLFEVLYISPMETYKNHSVVLAALSALRRGGIPARLTAVGGGGRDVVARLIEQVNSDVDLRGAVEFTGALGRAGVKAAYAKAHAFVFASTCENFPLTLLEALCAGLPTCAPSVGPMPEIMGDAGLYFDASNPDQLARILRTLYLDNHLRDSLGDKARARARAYSWERTAESTLALLARTCK